MTFITVFALIARALFYDLNLVNYDILFAGSQRSLHHHELLPLLFSFLLARTASFNILDLNVGSLALT